MNTDHIMWFGRHEGWLRHLSHGVRENDPQSVDLAARLFDLMLPDSCVVVPMPSHEGHSTYMYRVASKLCRRNRRMFADILSCFPHESHYDIKKRGVMPPALTMVRSASPRWNDAGLKVFVIDNTIGTGCTASAALEALKSDKYETFVCALSRGL